MLRITAPSFVLPLLFLFRRCIFQRTSTPVNAPGLPSFPHLWLYAKKPFKPIPERITCSQQHIPTSVSCYTRYLQNVLSTIIKNIEPHILQLPDNRIIPRLPVSQAERIQRSYFGINGQFSRVKRILTANIPFLFSK